VLITENFVKTWPKNFEKKRGRRRSRMPPGAREAITATNMVKTSIETNWTPMAKNFLLIKK